VHIEMFSIKELK